MGLDLAPGQGQRQHKPMGKGQDRARCRTSRRNGYYQTLIKYLILLLIQRMARARTGGGGSVHPPAFGCMGPIPLM